MVIITHYSFFTAYLSVSSTFVSYKNAILPGAAAAVSESSKQQNDESEKKEGKGRKNKK